VCRSRPARHRPAMRLRLDRGGQPAHRGRPAAQARTAGGHCRGDLGRRDRLRFGRPRRNASGRTQRSLTRIRQIAGMSVTSLVPQQPAPQPQAQTPAAALQLVKASLEALAAKLGQTLAATVLGTDANGLTQLKVGAEALTVKLTAPLPAGTQISVTV